MARITNTRDFIVLLDWNQEEFLVKYLGGNSSFWVSPLSIMLYEAEMQAWAQDPKGMDDRFVPDFVRPGKFKVKGSAR